MLTNQMFKPAKFRDNSLTVSVGGDIENRIIPFISSISTLIYETIHYNTIKLVKN